jgi:hypothetical protein
VQVIHDRLHSPSRHFLLGLVLSEFIEFFSLFAHVAAPRPLNLSLNLTPIPLVSVRTLAHEESSLASRAAAQAIHILHLHNIVAFHGLSHTGGTSSLSLSDSLLQRENVGPQGIARCHPCDSYSALSIWL